MPSVIYREERLIAASAEQVYDIIAGLEDYQYWNPWINSARGQTSEGAMVVVSARLYGKHTFFKHRMVASQRPSLFHWCDVGWFTLFVDGERKRHIEAIDEQRCRYRCELRVSGIGTPLARLCFGKFMGEGLKAEADALQQRAEMH